MNTIQIYILLGIFLLCCRLMYCVSFYHGDPFHIFRILWRHLVNKVQKHVRNDFTIARELQESWCNRRSTNECCILHVYVDAICFSTNAFYRSNALRVLQRSADWRFTAGSSGGYGPVPIAALDYLSLKTERKSDLTLPKRSVGDLDCIVRFPFSGI